VGLSDVDLCEKNKKLAKITHIDYVKMISNICYEYKIYLIHISTDHLFNGKKKYYSELSNPEPLNYYAKTKTKSEQIIKSKLEKYLIIRGNYYGWGTSYRKSFSDWIYETLSNSMKINLFTDIFFTPLYIRDFINIVFKLIQKKKNGIYNVSGSERISKYNFGIKLANEFNLNKKLIKKIKINKLNLVKRPKDMSLSSKKLFKTLNIDKDYYSIKNQLKRLKINMKKGIK
jgi:dTDP-4-dehydrorhamnose reductase